MVQQGRGTTIPGEGSQNGGKWDKVKGGESQFREEKVGQAWEEAGKGPPCPRYTHGRGEEGQDKDAVGVLLVVGAQRMELSSGGMGVGSSNWGC